MRLTCTVELNDGSRHEVTTNGFDLVMAEKHMNQNRARGVEYISLASDNPPFEALTYMVYQAMKRAANKDGGVPVPASFQKWLEEEFAGFELVDESEDDGVETEDIEDEGGGPPLSEAP